MTFEEILLEAIDDCFASLGESAKQAVYLYLENNYNISKQDIPNRIEDFTKAIEEIFEQGAELLEIKIMKNLFQRMGYVSIKFQTQENLEFIKYIESARTKTDCFSELVMSIEK